MAAVKHFMMAPRLLLQNKENKMRISLILKTNMEFVETLARCRAGQKKIYKKDETKFEIILD